MTKIYFHVRTLQKIGCFSSSGSPLLASICLPRSRPTERLQTVCKLFPAYLLNQFLGMLKAGSQAQENCVSLSFPTIPITKASPLTPVSRLQSTTSLKAWSCAGLLWWSSARARSCWKMAICMWPRGLAASSPAAPSRTTSTSALKPGGRWEAGGAQRWGKGLCDPFSTGVGTTRWGGGLFALLLLSCFSRVRLCATP